MNRTHPLRTPRMALAAALTLVSLSACVNFPYRAPIQQGNVIEGERLNAIREGMTKEQVAGILGSPILTDMFHQDRWDFVYRMDEHYRAVEQKRLSILFKQNKAVKVEQVNSK